MNTNAIFTSSVHVKCCIYSFELGNVCLNILSIRVGLAFAVQIAFHTPIIFGKLMENLLSMNLNIYLYTMVALMTESAAQSLLYNNFALVISICTHSLLCEMWMHICALPPVIIIMPLWKIIKWKTWCARKLCTFQSIFTNTFTFILRHNALVFHCT